MIERFFRFLEEECVWQQDVADFAEAKTPIARQIRWYNESFHIGRADTSSAHQCGARPRQAAS